MTTVLTRPLTEKQTLFIVRHHKHHCWGFIKDGEMATTCQLQQRGLGEFTEHVGGKRFILNDAGRELAESLSKPFEMKLGDKQRMYLMRQLAYVYLWCDGPLLPVARRLEKHGLIEVRDDSISKRSYITPLGRTVCAVNRIDARQRGLGPFFDESIL
jgi:hypothetical protein